MSYLRNVRNGVVSCQSGFNGRRFESVGPTLGWEADDALLAVKPTTILLGTQTQSFDLPNLVAGFFEHLLLNFPGAYAKQFFYMKLEPVHRRLAQGEGAFLVRPVIFATPKCCVLPKREAIQRPLPPLHKNFHLQRCLDLEPVRLVHLQPIAVRSRHLPDSPNTRSSQIPSSDILRWNEKAPHRASV